MNTENKSIKNTVRGTNERALAHIEKISSLDAIPGYDRVEQASILGWKVVVHKGEFQVGDLCCYFEIDSKLPEKEWSEFLRPKKFQIKTQKMCKTISQGLALSLSAIPELQNKELEIGADVTELLGVTYYVAEDNVRKAKSMSPNAKYDSMAARHKSLFKKKPFRWLMKRAWGRKLLFVIFGRKKDKPKEFPAWIVKTDETRIENAPWYLDSDELWVVTEKYDGTSSTYAIDFTKQRKGEFIVCSRNVRQADEKQECYHTCGNVYFEIAGKYNIETVLRLIAKEYSAVRVVLQGETYGESLQGNPYKISGRRFAAFNLIIDGRRLGSLEASEILAEYGVPFVAIIHTDYALPKDMETLKLEADGVSTIANVPREGFVYRSQDGKKSFKNVSRQYLLKHS